MNILLCNDSYYPVLDGVVLTVKNYGYYLNKKDSTCSLITVGYPNYKEIDKFKIFRTKSIKLPNNFLIWRIPLPILKRKDKRILNETTYDLIHTHSPFTIGRLGLRYAKKKNIPIITTFHSKYYQDFLSVTHSKFISKILLKYIIKYYNKCNYVWTVNESTALTLREYGYKGNIEIMPNGVDKVTLNNKTIKDIKNKYLLKKRDNILLFVGQLNFKKNIKLIFDALSLYKKKDNNFKLIMVGIGEDEKQIKVLAKKLNIINNIIFTGKISAREELMAIYHIADIFVFPSVYDNAPLVVREAAMFKTPSIVVKNAGASERIIDNVNGFLCKADPISLYKTIIKALSNKKQLKTIGINASKTIPILWENIIDKVYLRYKEIINEFNNKG